MFFTRASDIFIRWHCQCVIFNVLNWLLTGYLKGAALMVTFRWWSRNFKLGIFFQVRVKFQLTSGSLPYTVLRLIQRLASLNSVTDASEKTSHGYVINRLILVFAFHSYLLQKPRNKQGTKTQTAAKTTEYGNAKKPQKCSDWWKQTRYDYVIN